jgi:hypothetical protein
MERPMCFWQPWRDLLHVKPRDRLIFPSGNLVQRGSFLIWQPETEIVCARPGKRINWSIPRSWTQLIDRVWEYMSWLWWHWKHSLQTDLKYNRLWVTSSWSYYDVRVVFMSDNEFWPIKKSKRPLFVRRWERGKKAVGNGQIKGDHNC